LWQEREGRSTDSRLTELLHPPPAAS
jgi:hypothetical protein